MTFDDNGTNTGYFRDRLFLDSGAAVTNDHLGFNFYGGVDGVAQLAMLDNQGTATWNGGFKTDKSASKIEIGSDSTLCLNGVITGSQAITKAGAGTLTLTGVSTNTATLTISSGTVKLQDSGSWAGPIANSGILEVANATDRTIANTLSGAGTVKKSGEGTFSLTGSVSAPVEVAAGTLVIGDGSSAAQVKQAAVGCNVSAIDIAAGATYTVNTAGMAGSGTVMLPATTMVTVAEGGKLVVDTARQMNANVTGAGEVEVTNTATYVFAAD